MQLLVVRHGRAGIRGDFAETGRPDSERPLTDDGRKRFRECAAGLRTLVPELDAIATSPWARAVQTAELLAEAYEHSEPTIVDELVPTNSPELLASWLAPWPRDSRVAVCGHEPHLSEVVTWLLTGSSTPVLGMKKGGAVLLECVGAVAPRRFELVWALPPRVLRALS